MLRKLLLTEDGFGQLFLAVCLVATVLGGTAGLAARSGSQRRLGWVVAGFAVLQAGLWLWLVRLVDHGAEGAPGLVRLVVLGEFLAAAVAGALALGLAARWIGRGSRR